MCVSASLSRGRSAAGNGERPGARAGVGFGVRPRRQPAAAAGALRAGDHQDARPMERVVP